MAVGLFSCGSQSSVNQQDDDVLVTVGDSTLTMRDVLAEIPSGLVPEDSAMMFSTIVDEWVKSLVLTAYAEKNITDFENIERLVSDYRNNLIVERYLRSMADGRNISIPESRIKEYYNAHHAEMILEQPLVKGGLIKVAETDENINQLRQWMSSFTEESIDKIEKSGLRQASQYEYFKDEWQEWNVIADLIPYRFFDADSFVTSTRNFETSDAGSIYLLHISEYIPSGKEMPYEFARHKISEILRTNDATAARRNLISEIYKEQMSEGVLKPGSYDPVTRKMKNSGKGASK